MENFSYPVRLEPLNRPVKKAARKRVKRQPVSPQPEIRVTPVQPAAVMSAVAPRVPTPAPVASAEVAATPAEVVAASPKPATTGRKLKAPGLKEERERNGVSLKEIADRTRIPLRHLQELERGEIENWPAGVYAKSWARDYAKEAGIDPERVVAIVAPVAEVEPTIDEIKQVTEERERAAVDESPLAPLVQLTRKVATVAIVLVLLVLAALFFWRDGAPADQRNPAPVGTTGVAPAQPPSAPQ